MMGTERNEMKSKKDSILAQCHEVVILELGDLGESKLSMFKRGLQSYSEPILLHDQTTHQLIHLATSS